jgi:hypothetical protein
MDPSTHGKTSETLDEAFRTHAKLKHSRKAEALREFNLAAMPVTERHDVQNDPRANECLSFNEKSPYHPSNRGIWE